MWYLNVENILLLIGFVLFLAIYDLVGRGKHTAFRQLLLLCMFVGFLWINNRNLTLFYTAYVAISFSFCIAVGRTGKGLRKALFILGILFDISVFLCIRFLDIRLASMPVYLTIVTVGLAYNMLKAVDALYLAYFADRKINPLLYAVYMLFIPTFTSGPIMRYRDFEKDMEAPKPLDSKAVECSVKRVILGLFKKIVLAELLLSLYNHLLSIELNWIKSSSVLIIYYILLYLDFSGYSDIAIGFGRLMGFAVPENFKKPFSSPTLTQFWRNWHATLGDWFRDHIFVFMVRKGRNRLMSGLSAFAVMLAIGLWHGLQPLFVLWGLYHGTLLLFENVLNLSVFNRKYLYTFSYYLRCLLVNLLVAFGTIFFSRDMQTVYKILSGFLK